MMVQESIPSFPPEVNKIRQVIRKIELDLPYSFKDIMYLSIHVPLVFILVFQLLNWITKCFSIKNVNDEISAWKEKGNDPRGNFYQIWIIWDKSIASGFCL